MSVQTSPVAKVPIMVTINGVAKAAGVSKATVSYVLSGNPRISKGTVEKVRKTIDRLGYKVNHAARALSTARTMTLAVSSWPQQGPYLALSSGLHMFALSHYAAKYGYSLMFINDSDGLLTLRDIAESKRVDGVVIMDVREDDKRIEAAVDAGIPAVLFGYTDYPHGLTMIDSDYESEAAHIVSHLAERGIRETILFLQSKKVFRNRLGFAIRFRDAFLLEAASVGMKVDIVMPDDDDSDSSALIRDSILTHPEAGSIVFHNEAANIAAAGILPSMGLKVPDDYYVVGVIAKYISDEFHLPFVSIDTYVNMLAETVIHALVTKIETPEQRLSDQLMTFPLAVPFAG